VHRFTVICRSSIRQVAARGLLLFPILPLMVAVDIPPSEAVVGQLHPVIAGPRAIREAVQQCALQGSNSKLWPSAGCGVGIPSLDAIRRNGPYARLLTRFIRYRYPVHTYPSPNYDVIGGCEPATATCRREDAFEKAARTKARIQRCTILLWGQ
jgi:hypothetical protein